MRALWIAGIVLLVGCGDPESNDNRGYTKAPLEEPTVLVRGEPTTDMAELGDPVLPEAPLIEAEEPQQQQQQQPQQQTGRNQQQQAQLPAGVSAADVEEGKKLFGSSASCFACHGQEGAGTPLAPQLSDAQWLNIDGSFPAIQQVINSGVPQPKQFPAPMPPKGGATLNEQQVRQIAAYIYSISR